MKSTKNATKKNLKIKKKFKDGLDLEIHQIMSIGIRKYRYGANLVEYLNLFQIGN